MKAVHILFSTLFVSVLSRPTLVSHKWEKRDVDPNLVPELGLQAGLNPTGTGDCDGIPGANGVPIKIPCSCPPNRTVFLQALNANVAAGHAIHNPGVKISFPTDNSTQSQQDRITAAAITLQNLNGPGQGCPIVSTTLTAQSQAIQAAANKASSTPSQPQPAPQSSSSSSSSATPAKPSAPLSAPAPSSTLAIDPALVPDLGLQSGLNPTGTGDCDGIPGSNGVPIKIPCQCPPNRTTLLNSLSANVAAGFAVNNPGVKVTFPTDNSTNSQLARITALAITIQNLNGPGKGCPIASTTLTAQANAIQAAAAASSASAAASSTSSTSPSTPVVVKSSSSSVASPTSVVPQSAPTSSSSSNSNLAIDPALVPDLGLQSGLNPTGTGDCDGIPGSNGVPIKIPCQCPPDRTTLLNALSANVAAGHAVNNSGVAISFPTDNSTQSQLNRITAVVITLQNLNGPGKGCPLVSTTLAAQAQAIQNAASASSSLTQPSSTPVVPRAKTTTSSSAASTPTPTSGSTDLASAPASGTSSSSSQSVNNGNAAPSSSSSTSSNDSDIIDPNSIPDLGGVAGVNPTGTGECDGVVKQSNGQPIKVPCSCPPDRDTFIAALNANVAAGHATNNPPVPVFYPVGNSTNAQFDRLEAAIITLQNMNGPGQGCPVASTTLGQQQVALLNEINNSR
ncbi:hypothetical protein Clacol_010350 [Clathrus columnatus]|uniref:Uncharacterized protein n=1 Tax=Clathrus columnatus TaxID=1419009 RepID=A0AAV5AUT0_9AGAM|nr:hypothetical protein Clacol_010350 [Clathrus columnatus]